jgi:hypothetical protein
MLDILCYPNILIDKQWLKLTALYWDNIYVIASNQLLEYVSAAEETYIAEIEQLSQTLDLPLHHVLVEDLWSSDMDEEFRKWIDKNSNVLTSKSAVTRYELLWEDKKPLFFSGAFALLESMGLVVNTPGEKHKVRIPIWEHHLRLPEEYLGTAESEPPATKLFVLERSRRNMPHPKKAERAARRVRRSEVRVHSREVLVRPEARLALARFVRARRSAERAPDSTTRDLLQQEVDRIYEESLVEIETQDRSLMEMRADIASEYFARIALAAAERYGADLFANNEYFARTALLQKATLGTDVAIGTLKAFIPKDVEAMTPEQIGELRKSSKTQRLRYQKEISSLIKEYGVLTSESRFVALKRRLIDLASERVEETRQAYKHLKLETVLRSFGVALTPPALASGLASILGTGIFAPAAIAAAVGLFAAQTLLSVDRARLEREKSAWSYILNLQGHLK